MANIVLNSLYIVNKDANSANDSQKSQIKFYGFSNSAIDPIENSNLTIPDSSFNTIDSPAVLSQISSSHVGSNTNFQSKIVFGTNDGTNNISSSDGTFILYSNTDTLITSDFGNSDGHYLEVVDANNNIISVSTDSSLGYGGIANQQGYEQGVWGFELAYSYYTATADIIFYSIYFNGETVLDRYSTSDEALTDFDIGGVRYNRGDSVGWDYNIPSFRYKVYATIP